MQRHCVSAVVPVRHDNWGGGLALRAQTTLPHLAAAFDELLLVDFNSQNGTAATKVVYVESPGVVPERVAERFRGMTTNTRIAEYNAVAREEIAALGARDDLLSVGGVFALSAAAANLYEADGVHFQRASTWYGGVASAALRKVCGSGSL